MLEKREENKGPHAIFLLVILNLQTFMFKFAQLCECVFYGKESIQE